jgi:zinc-binding alcohol dehydrogenase family protein
MKAVGYRKSRPIDAPDALLDVELPRPVATGHDLLVRIAAVSVNPVDTKVRRRAEPPEGEVRVLGWDAVGTVEAAGPDCTLFKPGDRVFYAGALDRQGTNAEYHLVDERLVGPRPQRLTDAEAAALPLTALTAWEMLFDRLDVRRPVPGGANAILIIGGAGGVGSIAIQLAKALTGLAVIATASRPETQDWVRGLGADHVVDHGKPLAEGVAALGIGAPGLVFSTTQSDQHFDAIAELIAPQGRFGLIDDPGPIDVRKLKRKSTSLHWELMYTRSSFATPDMIEQHRALAEVSRLVDAGRLRSTLAANFGPCTAANLKRAHALLESGTSKGKIVLEGF